MVSKPRRTILDRSRLSFPSLKASIYGAIATVVALLVIVPMMIAPSTANTPTATRFVSPDWLVEHADDSDLRVLDVRINPLDYIAGHVPGAVHVADNTFRGPNGRLPIQYWDVDKLEFLFQQAGVSNSSTVVVYSDENNILGSTMVGYLLERSSLPNVAILDGGFKGYREAGLPTTKEFLQYSIGDFTVQDQPALRVSLDEVRDLVGNPNITFIDPRPPALFAGEVDLFVRNGHIPGAKNIPWPSFTIGEDNLHQLKPLDDIRALLDQRGITPDDTIIVTCSTGREATLQYTVLKHLLDYPNVRIYEGSWTEYSSQPDLPVETGRDPDLA